MPKVLVNNNKFAWIWNWSKFNLVGLLGIILQLSLLKLFTVMDVGYLVATSIAVEITIIHNFFWHEHWTWQERTTSCNQISNKISRLIKFNTTTGLISLIGNLLLMKLFVEALNLPIALANLFAIGICGIFNFLVSNLVVFPRQEEKHLELKT